MKPVRRTKGMFRSCMVACMVALVACSQPPPPTTVATPPSSTLDPIASTSAQGKLTVPKVPFGNQPCQSLSQDEQQGLEQSAWGYSRPVPGKPDRAPAGLPYDNVCIYNGFNVGYMTQVDYQTNHDGNHSTQRADPPGLPGAFYDKQGGLWFATNGYFVVVAGSHKLEEAAAHAIAGKL